MTLGTRLAIGFACGVAALLLAHQPTVHLLGQLGLGRGGDIYSLASVAPLGVPRIVSQCFWGGLWGAAFAWFLFPRLERGPKFYVITALVGGLAVVAVGWFIVAPIRGTPIAGGWNLQRMGVGWLINGMFALGVAIVYALATRTREAAALARG